LLEYYEDEFSGHLSKWIVSFCLDTLEFSLLLQQQKTVRTLTLLFLTRLVQAQRPPSSRQLPS